MSGFFEDEGTLQRAREQPIEEFSFDQTASNYNSQGQGYPLENEAYYDASQDDENQAAYSDQFLLQGQQQSLSQYSSDYFQEHYYEENQAGNHFDFGMNPPSAADYSSPTPQNNFMLSQPIRKDVKIFTGPQFQNFDHRFRFTNPFQDQEEYDGFGFDSLLFTNRKAWNFKSSIDSIFPL